MLRPELLQRLIHMRCTNAANGFDEHVIHEIREETDQIKQLRIQTRVPLRETRCGSCKLEAYSDISLVSVKKVCLHSKGNFVTGIPLLHPHQELTK